MKNLISQELLLNAQNLALNHFGTGLSCEAVEAGGKGNGQVNSFGVPTPYRLAPFAMAPSLRVPTLVVCLAPSDFL